MTNEGYQDQELNCIEEDCHAPFTWTAEEQEFYAEKNFGAPKRCKPCRPIARQRFNDRQAGKNTPPPAPVDEGPSDAEEFNEEE